MYTPLQKRGYSPLPHRSQICPYCLTSSFTSLAGTPPCTSLGKSGDFSSENSYEGLAEESGITPMLI
jgi:hypothetical protein